MSVTYEWNPGSLPPPAYYELRISVDDGGSGTVEVRPDHAFNQPPTWTWSFALSSGDSQQLLNEIAQQAKTSGTRSAPPSVGGPQERMTLTEDGRKREVAPFPTTVERLKAAVPQSIWEEIDGRRTAYTTNE
jgi:hypothetical protein